jgi:hypothetical protein
MESSEEVLREIDRGIEDSSGTPDSQGPFPGILKKPTPNQIKKAIRAKLEEIRRMRTLDKLAGRALPPKRQRIRMQKRGK